MGHDDSRVEVELTDFEAKLIDFCERIGRATKRAEQLWVHPAFVLITRRMFIMLFMQILMIAVEVNLFLVIIGGFIIYHSLAVLEDGVKKNG